MKTPMHFTVASSSAQGSQTAWEGSMEGLEPIALAIPPEFGGPGGGYSPEDLFALAALNCLIATYKVYAEKVGLKYREISGVAKLTIDKPDKHPLAITHIDIDMKVTGAEDKGKTEKILEDAKRGCLVENAMKVDLRFVFTVE